MKTYKGFDKNLVCRDFQYEIGEEYECETAKICKSGFHACIDPNDVFAYYPPNTSRFCEVEIDGDVKTHHEDSKVCGTRIRVIREFTPVEFMQECMDFQSDKKTQASGYKGHAQASGYKGHAQASGTEGHAQTSGSYGHAQASGYQGHAQASGYQGHAQASGNHGHAQASDRYGHAQASGYKGHAQASGKNSTASAVGPRSTAMASGDCEWISLVEYDDHDNIVFAKWGKVGVDIEKDTTYQLKNGNFVKVKK